MQIETSTLIDDALNWAVAKAEGKHLVFFDDYFLSNAQAGGLSPARADQMLHFQPLKRKWCSLNASGGCEEIPPYSTDPAYGCPIIWREEIGTKRRAPCMKGEEWEAMGSITAKGAGYGWATGPTPLIAALRCRVEFKLGKFVDIPGELLKVKRASQTITQESSAPDGGSTRTPSDSPAPAQMEPNAEPAHKPRPRRAP